MDIEYKIDNLICIVKYCSSEYYKNYMITVSGRMGNTRKGKDIVLDLALFIFNWRDMHKETENNSRQTMLH